jgi:chemotaxis protein MotA
MKIERLAILGLLLGIAALAGGQVLEGGSLGVLINEAAAVIVLGGSIAAVMVQTPAAVFSHALRLTPRVLLRPEAPFGHGLQRLVQWSATARREGLLGLEDVADQEPDDFIRHGLVLLVDGAEPDVIRSSMENELALLEEKQREAVRVFEAMGGYSPTMGIIGAVLGLIHVMGNLTEPSKLGPGIATAFVATVYGVGFANLILLPIAHKLKYQIADLSRFREMMIEGLVSIAEGENPRIIEYRLGAYLRSSGETPS